uniref:UPAR/Ly6 domain-containing protein n=1 Tax=Salvator merianae TaxID=96440 RepID=A0A8D0BQD6_SALMN
GPGGALKCYNCYRELRNGTCVPDAPPCTAQPGESCYRQQIFAEHVVLYSSSGCIRNCKNVQAGVYIHHINRCCSHKDLCNLS